MHRLGKRDVEVLHEPLSMKGRFPKGRQHTCLDQPSVTPAETFCPHSSARMDASR
jgi:hypothetical protein